MPESGKTMFTSSNITSVEGFKDQYADGKAAKFWEFFSRTEHYKKFLIDLLREKRCKRILDVACGTGLDSKMLVEMGFEVVSTDASDQMLKYALKDRWNRRHEQNFENWIIEEANWLTLYDDIEELVGDGFDAILCLGNSFAHLTDNFGDQREQKQAIKNFEKCLKPGGLLLIDHRNYDNMIDTGSTSTKCVYYNNEHLIDIKPSISYVKNKPHMVTLDYCVFIDNVDHRKFSLSYYPHRLSVFKKILQDIFHQPTKYDIYGDFKLLSNSSNSDDPPAFYIHAVVKSK